MNVCSDFFLCNHYRKVDCFNHFVYISVALNEIEFIVDVLCVHWLYHRQNYVLSLLFLPVFNDCKHFRNLPSQSQWLRVNCWLLQRPRLHSPGDNVYAQRSCSRQHRSSSAYRPTSLYSVAIEPDKKRREKKNINKIETHGETTLLLLCIIIIINLNVKKRKLFDSLECMRCVA